MDNNEIEVGAPVRVNDERYGVDVTGVVYERGWRDYGPPTRIYGVRLDKVIWAGGLCTEVWHCRGELLALIAESS